jgi:glycosyltransferase involved in cell wall biosynthesis
MKISFILPHYPWKSSGGFRVIYEYANHFVRRGYWVTIIHPYPKLLADWLPLDFINNNQHQKINIFNIFTRFLIKKWQFIDKRINICCVKKLTSDYVSDSDVIFATAWQTAERVAKYPLSKGRKFYLIMDFDHYFGSQKKLEATWNFPFKKITISSWLYGKVVSVTKDQKNIINIPIGVDFNRFKKKTDIKNRPKEIAMMLSSKLYKRTEDGLRALEICKRRFPKLQTTCFGSRPNFKIPKWINFRYNVPEKDLVNIYNQSKIFVCSSLAEGFALPPAEAMSCGCAVVSTDCGGNREYVKDGFTAFLSPPSNYRTLAKNIIKLLVNDDLRIKIAETGYKYIQQFTWNKSTDSLEKFIKKNAPEK